MGLAQQALMEYSFSCVAGVAQWESTSFTRMGSAVQSCPPAFFFCFLTVKYIYHTLPSLGDSLERVLSLDEEFTAIFGTVYKASLKAASNNSSFLPQKMTSPFSKFEIKLWSTLWKREMADALNPRNHYWS